MWRLNAETAREYLVAKGFSNPRPLWARSRRHVVLAVATDHGALVVKQQGDDALFPDASLSAEFWLARGGIRHLPSACRRMIPPVRFVDSDALVLATTYYRAAGPLALVLSRRPEHGTESTRALGRWLGILHGSTSDSLDTLPTRPAPPRWSAPSETSWTHFVSTPPLVHDFLARIRSKPGLIEAIDALHTATGVETLVHGDLKLDNVLWVRGGARPVFKVIDWELCGRGDPHADLGKILGHLLSIWIDTVRVAPDLPPVDWFTTARIPYDRAMEWAKELLVGYRAGLGNAASLLDPIRATRWAGLALIEGVSATAHYASDLHAQDLMRLRLARTLLMEPARFGAALETGP